MSNFEITGQIVQIGQTEVKTEKFSVREFAIQFQTGNEGQYTDYASFRLANAKTSLVDGLQVGQTVTVKFNVRGREWNGKYFTNLEAWKIDPATKPEDMPMQQPKQDDGLPF